MCTVCENPIGKILWSKVFLEKRSRNCAILLSVRQYLSDHPILADSFDRYKLIEQVGKRVQNCRPPHVIGLYGDWGSGKTSFLRGLQLYLCGTSDLYDEKDVAKSVAATNPKEGPVAASEVLAYGDILELDGAGEGYPVVWFDAWRYQTEGSPIVALLHEIRRHFSPGGKFGQFAQKIGTVAAQATLYSLDGITKEVELLAPGLGFATKTVGNIVKAGEAYERRNFSTPLAAEQIRAQLNHAIGKVLENVDPNSLKVNIWQKLGKKAKPAPDTKRRLIVIIDDLDRCEPEVALRLLEGIKIFFNLDNCVFVLGVNPKRLEEHIATAYQRDSKSSAEAADCLYRAQDYLNKIINTHYEFGLPRNLDKLLKSLLPSLTIMGVDRADEVREVIVGDQHLPPNPRRLTSILNTLYRYQDVAFPQTPDARLLVAFAYLNEFHGQIVRKMAWHQEFAEAFVQDCLKSDEAPPTGEMKNPEERKTYIWDDPRFPDPIYDNVIHVKKLFHEWSESQSADEKIDIKKTFEPYILLS